MKTRKLYDGNLLYESYLLSKKNSSWKWQVQEFEIDFLKNIKSISDDLKNHTYKPQPGHSFVLNERGHIRYITGGTMRDRVVRHALCDEYLVPAITNRVIYDNAASQKRKCTHFARERLKVHLHQYYRKFNTNKGYILFWDFTKYYDNIRHADIYEQFSKIINNEDVLWLLKIILKNFEVDVSYMSDEDFVKALNEKYNALEYSKTILPSEKKGEKFLKKSVCIGDQSSQGIGVYYPYKIDNLVKIIYQEKFYGRYMDDSYIISPDKEHLKMIIKEVYKQAKDLGIFINEKKTHILRIDKPFIFLQNSYTLTKTGHIIEKVNKKRLSSMRRKLKKLRKKINNKEIPLSAMVEMYRSWIGNYKPIMSRKQRKHLNHLYKSLIKYGG